MTLAHRDQSYSKENILQKLVQGKYGSNAKGGPLKWLFFLDNTRIGISWNTVLVPVAQVWGNFTDKIDMQCDTLRTDISCFSSDFADYSFTVKDALSTDVM